MRNFVLAVSLAAMPVLTIADQAREIRPVTRRVVRRPSQERLDQIRRSLLSQVVVRDGEGVRAPTAAEAETLSGSSSQTFQTVSLPGGGIALMTNGAQLSMVMAVRGVDGTIRVAHEATPTTSGAGAKGGSHVR